MTARNIRRAAERRANKLARKAELARPVESALPVSEAQLAANQANAQLSTGPKTAAGKAISSLNAVTSALTGRTVLLPADDAVLYTQHVLAYENQYHPVGPIESGLVQSLADTDWRLRRIPGLEMAIFAKGRIEFASQFEEGFEHYDAAHRASLIDAHTFLTYEKQIRNLQLQESRLTRRRDKESAELRRLQNERRERAQEDSQHEMASAAKLFLEAKQNNELFDSGPHGFEFSNRQMPSRAALAYNPLPSKTNSQAA
ncbi:MAG TPA: hypothetical protein VK604_13705 [Bryobacteraceae bacterium]|nr:hypothetical protein [Bryobacteraceae bacterium]